LLYIKAYGSFISVLRTSMRSLLFCSFS